MATRCASNGSTTSWRARKYSGTPLVRAVMFRARGENLRSVYILLFLNIAFFLMQYENAERFSRIFSFDAHAVAHGEVWRLLTYQFIQASRIGTITIHPAITLFLNLVLLTLMGMSIEEAWGTRGFLTLYAVSTLASAGVAAYLGVPLLGSYFINFTLLFVYASLFRDQTFYLSLAFPVRVTFLAWLALGALLAGVFFGNKANIAALVGAAAGFAFFMTQRITSEAELAPVEPRDDPMLIAPRNLTRVAAVKRALTTRSQSDIDRLIGLSENEIVKGVNICAPIDYKPEHNDRYCVRCEGFAECTARYRRLNRPAAPPPAAEPALHGSGSAA